MNETVRVLYAEDDRADADLTKTYFRSNAPDFALDVVETGEKCLARLKQGTYDVLLLDNRLPDMDGTDVLNALAAQKVSLPVVMVTAAGDEALVVRVLRLGACDYVPKQGNYIETLPAVLKRAVTDYRSLQEQPYAAGRQQRRILYVEQHPADIDLTLAHFAEGAAHFTLDVVRSAAHALTRLQEHRFDLVLADLRMPDMSALDLLREAKHRELLVPFIIITGRGDEAAAVAALKLGAYDYIVKRDNYLTQLPYAIENAISRFELLHINRHLQTELSERERLQRSTIESLELLGSLQTHAPIGIGFLDRDYRFQRVNDEFAAITGLPSHGPFARTVAEILPGTWPQLEPLCRQVLAGDAVLKAEISGETLARPGEQRQWLASLYPVRSVSQEVRGIGVFVADISERKRAEAALRDQAAALAEAARQKDEFLAMLSHELRNPLAPIRTALELVRRSGGVQDGLALKALDVMSRQITHMARLLDDLLEVSRITSGRIQLNVQQLDVRQVVGEAIDSARMAIDARRHQLNTSLSPEPLLVRGDFTRLVQVLVNLLNNAAKYTDEGGTIRITATAENADAVVRVTDTGVGISPRLLPKIFDLFTQDDRTLDRALGGLGLGLTVVRRITELHGGRVEAHSEGRGRGSEFIVKLPLHVPATTSKAPHTPTSRRPSYRPLRCLVVEDNIDAANMLKVALGLEGHEVRLAFDGPDAIQAAALFQPEAIVLDLGLPRMNGYDAARAIRQLPGLANVLIIAATGYGQEADRQKSRDAGIDEHLVKPIELEALLRALSEGRTARMDG